MTNVHRIRKADIKSGTGSYQERALRRQFKQATHVKKVRMCRGCSKPKDQCDCPKSCLEASRRFNAIIERMRAEWDAEDRAARKAKRVARKRAQIKIVKR